MSKIGRIPVLIPPGVTVAVLAQEVCATGPKGTLSFPIPTGVVVVVNQNSVQVSIAKESQGLSPVFGLTRAYIANMITGVSHGFEKKLELSGVGYRAQVVGADLHLSLGFSHPVTIKAEDGISFAVLENIISILGIDKDRVGNMAARIRDIRPPEPYKGKGIKYVGEKIRRKAGKAAKAVGSK